MTEVYAETIFVAKMKVRPIWVEEANRSGNDASKTC